MLVNIADYRSVFPFSGHAIARFGVLQVKISPLIHNIKIYILFVKYILIPQTDQNLNQFCPVIKKISPIIVLLSIIQVMQSRDS